jgi:predicted RNase H-like HicB family nuclease
VPGDHADPAAWVLCYHGEALAEQPAKLDEMVRMGLRSTGEETSMADQPFSLDFGVTLTAVVRPEEVGGYSAEVPLLPGCVTEAETLEELRDNLREAAEGWLEAMQDLARLRQASGATAP